MLINRLPLSLLYRRAALSMWKQRLGSDATYQKLIDIFESAGYRSYAAVVRNIACSVESHKGMDDFGECNDFLSQPDTYPHHEPNISLTPKFLTQDSSSYDEYLEINVTPAQNLPQGKKSIASSHLSSTAWYCNVLTLIR